MDDHLDMHFRQNRKANQNIGRGHSRSWFIGLEDWIQDISGDRKGKGRVDGSGPLNAKASAAAENAKREADLQAQYVIVPPGDEAQVVSCPICKETLKSEFLDEVEDWVWKNAIKKDDRIFHATCHDQALSLTSSFAAKLRTEKLNGSRSGTPEVQSISVTHSGLRSTPPPTLLRISKSPSHSPPLGSKGTKRKVDDHGDLNSSDQTDSPPLKKIALSPLSS
jgi:pre-mRNA cleavage complex 2 protein Pcf11